MAYDIDLANRVRNLLPLDPAISEKKMFGGVCFLHNGNLVLGIVKTDLMVRVGPDNYQDALSHIGVREMDFTGKPLKGMVYVNIDVIENDDDLFEWLQRGLDFAVSLPPKKANNKN